ncbi:hypothetical protein [Streptosporangium sp. NPDC087985]|uniref:hypothetical protein n=1 Tax=Streptosporangium sp. NPDC087985 TaxID=3366196 RepID=UPI00380A4824
MVDRPPPRLGGPRFTPRTRGPHPPFSNGDFMEQRAAEAGDWWIRLLLGSAR